MGWKLRFALLFIILVSCLDVWFCLEDAEFLKEFEMNPLARWVIERAGVHGLVAIKHGGVATVVASLCHLEDRRYRFRRVVLWVILAIQALVLGCYVVRCSIYCPFDLWRLANP